MGTLLEVVGLSTENTVGEAVTKLRETGAEQVNIIGRGSDGAPEFGFFLIDSPELVSRVLNLIEEWEREAESPS